MNDESLRMTGPCPKKWAELQGEGPRRFCSECSLHVHDSTALTRTEAEELARGEGRSCMRLVLDDQGSPVFADSPRRRLRWMLAAGAGLLAACPSAAPEVEGTTPPDPAPNTTEQPADGECMPELMGEVVAHEIMGRVAAPDPEFMGDVEYIGPEELERLDGPDEAPDEDPDEDPDGETDR